MADPATILVVAGGLCEATGIGIAFYELALIRSHEFGVALPWARRRLEHRDGHANRAGFGASPAGYSVPAREHVRRRVSIEDEMQWGRDLNTAVDRTMREITEQSQRDDARMKAELQAERAREEMRRKAILRPSLQRQGIGLVLVLIGLVLGTIGGLL
ncbi:hypothetical protein [Conexibacter arvalis]|uniref:Uncharacterized protein n=1 Tax=Conexibacter arvalis TaxID=912552 RepID=A0A840IED5_9ACTN|nr:hypothetical protein [Conexibacter arvalis]MBB4663172.1 hypothetical protein [Conexibacter arvalis]